jgi:hypothetical protein
MRETFKTQTLALLLSFVVMSGACAMEDPEDRDGGTVTQAGPGTLTLSGGNIPEDTITIHGGQVTLPNGVTVTVQGGTLTLPGSWIQQGKSSAGR